MGGLCIIARQVEVKYICYIKIVASVFVVKLLICMLFLLLGKTSNDVIISRKKNTIYHWQSNTNTLSTWKILRSHRWDNIKKTLYHIAIQKMVTIYKNQGAIWNTVRLNVGVKNQIIILDNNQLTNVSIGMNRQNTLGSNTVPSQGSRI